MTGLAGYLAMVDCNDAYIAGLALDYCVYWTALDSLRSGRRTTVIVDACRGITPESVKEALADMASKGVNLKLSTDIAC